MPSKRKRGGGRQVVEVDGSGTETDDRYFDDEEDDEISPKKKGKAKQKKKKQKRKRRRADSDDDEEDDEDEEDEEDEEEDPRVNKRMKTGSTGKQKGKTGKVQSVRWCTAVSLLPCFGRTPFFDTTPRSPQCHILGNGMGCPRDESHTDLMGHALDECPIVLALTVALGRDPAPRDIHHASSEINEAGCLDTYFNCGEAQWDEARTACTPPHPTPLPASLCYQRNKRSRLLRAGCLDIHNLFCGDNT